MVIQDQQSPPKPQPQIQDPKTIEPIQSVKNIHNRKFENEVPQEVYMSKQFEQDQLSKISEDVGRENIEYERYKARLKKATEKQNRVFDQYYN